MLIALGGLASAPLIAIATSGTGLHEAELVSRIANTVRMAGASLGLAALLLFAASAAKRLPEPARAE